MIMFGCLFNFGDRFQSPFCNFPVPRKADAYPGGIDRLVMIRASAPIRLPANEPSAVTPHGSPIRPLVVAGVVDPGRMQRGVAVANHHSPTFSVRLQV
jgi:hypothetical protein